MQLRSGLQTSAVCSTLVIGNSTLRMSVVTPLVAAAGTCQSKVDDELAELGSLQQACSTDICVFLLASQGEGVLPHGQQSVSPDLLADLPEAAQASYVVTNARQRL